MGISSHKFVAGDLGRHTRTRVHGQIHGQDRPLRTDLRPRCHPALLRNSPLRDSSAPPTAARTWLRPSSPHVPARDRSRLLRAA
jgi:hypothetical protein